MIIVITEKTDVQYLQDNSYHISLPLHCIMFNQEWAIQRNWQQDEEKQSKNTTQYVLDTTMRKHTQKT
jgi:hypothetical protein